MNDVIILIKSVSDVGIPIVLAVVVVVAIVKVINSAPKVVSNYIASKNDAYREQQEKYDQLFTTITTLAQQQIEAQKCSNEVIKQNNIVIEANRQSNEKMTAVMESLISQSARVDKSVCKLTELHNQSYIELVRVGEQIKSMKD